MSDDAVIRDETGDTKIEARDPATGRFAPGNKTGGRSRLSPEVREMLRAATVPAVQALLDALKAHSGKDANGDVIPDHDIRVKAANALLDRGIGKAVQAVSIGLEDEDGNAMRLGVVLLPATSAE